ncbi:MAG: lipoprotein insertase outer membrane protein LolB [Pseudomonadota bacterium]
MSPVSAGGRSLRPPPDVLPALCLAAALLLPILLGGCETVPEAAEPEPVADPLAAFERRQAVLGQIQNWSANGRLALNTPGDSVNASVRWQQIADDYVIRLSGPLGIGGASLAGGPAGVTLRTDDKDFSAPTPEALLKDNLGWQLPVSGLKYWLMGLIAPNVQIRDVRFDPAGRLEYLEQANWKIQYRRYLRTETMDMPSKVFMESPRVGVRIIVQEWDL